TYDRVSGPMEAMGLEVLSRLELQGDETVIDAGCGSGRITAALLERLPRGRVIAVDGAPSMIEAARERLGGRAHPQPRGGAPSARGAARWRTARGAVRRARKHPRRARGGRGGGRAAAVRRVPRRLGRPVA